MYLSGSANCKRKGCVQSWWDVYLFGCNTTNWFPGINGCCRPPHPHSFSMQSTLTTVYCWLILVVYSVPVSKTYPSNQAITEREIENGCISVFQSTTVNRLMTSVREWNWQSEVPVNVIIVVKTFFGGEIVGFCGFQENVFLYPTEGPFPSACRLH